MTVKKGMIRQGDLLVRRINKKDLPDRLQTVEAENGKLVLAHGEATGHHHAVLDEPGVKLLSRDLKELSDKFLQVEREHTATLTHQEHSPIELGEGTWIVTRQREYVEKNKPRPVYD